MSDTTSRQNVTRLRFDPRYLNRQAQPASRAGHEADRLRRETRPAELTGAFEVSGIGIALVSASGRMLAYNIACEEILAADRSGLVLTNGELRTRRRPDRQALEDALQSTACHGKASALRIPDLESEQVTELLITRVPATPDTGPRLKVVMRAPEMASPDPDLLAQLYGLTPAEAGLTGALARGAGLAEACRMREITVNTGKGYLKRIFQKTGTNRQSELVALVMNGVAALNPAAMPALALSHTG